MLLFQAACVYVICRITCFTVILFFIGWVAQWLFSCLVWSYWLCPGCLACFLILQLAFYGACLMAAQMP